MIATFIILALLILALIIATVNHGKPKGEYNAYISFFALIFWLILFYYAGLFDKFIQ